MNVANIISALGNNASLTPIIVKDNIENASRVVLAHNQGNKVSKEMAFYEARENAIEEFGASALWLATPVVTDKAFKAVVKKNFKLKGQKSNDILEADSKLLNGKHYQTLEKNIKHAGDNYIKSDAKKIKASKINSLMKVKGGLATVATVGLITGLTILKQKITERSLDQKGTPDGLSFKGIQKIVKNKIQANPTFSSFINIESEKAPKDIAFKGVVTQAAIDGGMGAMRVATSRNEGEKKEYAFKTVAFIGLCYGGGILLEKGFNAAAKAMKLPINLDAKLLGSEKFTNKIVKAAQSEDEKKKLLSFVKVDKNASEFEKEKTIVKFIEKEIEKGQKDSKGNFKEFNNATLEVARKSGLIKVENNKRAVTKFIDTKSVQEVNNHLGDLVNIAQKKGKGNLKGFMRKVKGAKYGSVLANIGISIALTAVALPKMQYLFRENSIGQVASPGVKATARRYKDAA